MRFPTSGFFYELVWSGSLSIQFMSTPSLEFIPTPGPDALTDLSSWPPLVQMYSLTWSRCTHWPKFMPTPGPDVLTNLSSCPPLVQMYSLTWVHAHPWSRCTLWLPAYPGQVQGSAGLPALPSPPRLPPVPGLRFLHTNTFHYILLIYKCIKLSTFSGFQQKQVEFIWMSKIGRPAPPPPRGGARGSTACQR
jgi:hypothetical protein